LLCDGDFFVANITAGFLKPAIENCLIAIRYLIFGTKIKEKNMLKTVVAIMLLAVASAQAQEIDEGIAVPGAPTVVFGEAANKNGTDNIAVVEQPQNAPNPLGAPIVDNEDTPAPKKQDKPKFGSAVQIRDEVEQTTPQNPQISPQLTPEQLNNEMQNEVYESGNRVYDVQSYPASDLPQIEQQQNAITNYPEY